MKLLDKLKKHGFFKYGTVIPNLKINGEDAPYPVVNDREVRAGAGIMFVMGIFAFTSALLIQNYLFLKIVVVIFFIDFLFKVIIGTNFSPINNLAKLIVKKQRPEYVGATQKRFAWSIGLIMASLMMILLFVLDVRGPINLAVCLICLTFMWFETSFGICIGCKMYYGLIKIGVIQEPAIRPACPGGVCSIKKNN